MPDPVTSPADPASGGTPDPTPTTPPAINLQDPAVVAAIKAASEAAVAKVTTDYETRLKGLDENKTKILEEKKKLADEIEKVRLEVRAKEIQADPEKLNKLAEELATTKFEAHKRAYKEVEDAREKEIEGLKAEREALSSQLRRAVVLRELYSAAIPEDQKLIHDGAFDYLCSRLESITEEKKLDGLPMSVLRFKVGGTYLPANTVKTPDGLMGMREFLAMSREGKGPVTDLDFCFVSAGRGSDTRQPNKDDGATGGDVDWGSLSDDQRTALTSKNGQAWALKQIDRASAKRFKKAS